jgi:6-phosphofructokinase 2
VTPILTLTLNPAIDGSCEAEVVRPIRKVRTSRERYEPGGGGINVSRVVRILGGVTRAVYLAGGATGSVFDALLLEEGVEGLRVPIRDHTRISQTVYERSTGLEYRFVPEGPEVGASEWQGCLDSIAAMEFRYLVASGSLPRGVPADFYCRVSDLARAKGAKFVLDTSGEALRRTVAHGGIFLVKPSLGEFEALVGRAIKDHAAQGEAAMALVRSGAVETVALTMGHEGALLATAAGVARRPAMEVQVRSAVGAGDSFLAAMTLALARGAEAGEAFLWGIAAGTAAVTTPGTELCRREDVERLFRDLIAAGSQRP